MNSPAPLDLDRVLTTLAKHGVEFVVIGGLAVIAHGHARATFDLGICHNRSQLNAGALLRALRELDARIVHEDQLMPLPDDFRVLQRNELLILRTNSGDLDCVGVPDGTQGYPDLVVDAWRIPYAGVETCVASLDALIGMKLASGEKIHRSKDRQDLETLREIAEHLNAANSTPSRRSYPKASEPGSFVRESAHIMDTPHPPTRPPRPPLRGNPGTTDSSAAGLTQRLASPL